MGSVVFETDVQSMTRPSNRANRRAANA